jgi:dynamin-like GTPase MGM1, mitochondrial
MSGRLISTRLALLTRRATLYSTRRVGTYTISASSGLLRTDSGLRLLKQRSWPHGSYSLHNVPAIRTISSSSFARVIPKLVSKLTTLSAVAGASVVAGLSYIQYQAGRKSLRCSILAEVLIYFAEAGSWALEVFNRSKDWTSETAREAYGSANHIFLQTKRGWDRTKENIELPQWLQTVFERPNDSGNSNGSSQQEDPKGFNSSSAATVTGTTTAAALGYGTEDDSDMGTREQIARDEQMMLFTKKMIEIRSLLQTVGQSESLTLPSIVVIGSQSSGKSSVLEAIVGHEFLPKGHNMVTRRPIELTLINTPDAHAEFGEFPALGLGKITDFSHIQKTITDLNLAVPTEDCVSDEPIQLRIYSPNVPDLSLIDLPGYIQVTGRDQPPELKQKIADLCERYIQSPNIILAISAADVDLANSTALRASRKVDPRGERTIGVITKMDLVDPERGVNMLTDRKYQLRLGYVGVVCRPPQAPGGLFHRGSGNITNAIAQNERSYFSSHPEEFGRESETEVGTPNLKRKLMQVLEQAMASSLKTTGEAIARELAETSYEFKVQYNERSLSAESYLAESLDAFKHSFKSFTEQFGRAEIREILKNELDQQVLNLLAGRYWNRPFEDLSPPLPETDSLKDLPRADPDNQIWRIKLDSSSASLTKLGIGRLATTVIANALQTHVDHLISESRFSSHPIARQAIEEASSSILKDLSYDISDELEICIKPYKYRIEVDDSEWMRARDNISKVLKEELQACESANKEAEQLIGGKRKAKDVVNFIDRVRNRQVVLEGDGIGGAGGFSAALLAKGMDSARAFYHNTRSS